MPLAGAARWAVTWRGGERDRPCVTRAGTQNDGAMLEVELAYAAPNSRGRTGE